MMKYWAEPIYERRKIIVDERTRKIELDERNHFKSYITYERDLLVALTSKSYTCVNTTNLQNIFLIQKQFVVSHTNHASKQASIFDYKRVGYSKVKW